MIEKNALSAMLDETIVLIQKFVQAESISPCDGRLHEIIADYLSQLGFEIEHMNIEDTKNIYAHTPSNSSGPYTCFAGHTDVVPTGEGWKHPPYSGAIENGYIFGRGTNDMKGTIACAMVVFKYLLQKNPNLNLAMLLTSDEEAIAEHGLKKITPILINRNEPINLFVLGEPTALQTAGDTVKIGRRGSISAIAKIFGIQGHIAYPELAKNPIPIALNIAKELDEIDFADDHKYFGKTRLQLTQIDAFNKAMNVIPGIVELRFGTRFNTNQNEDSIKNHIIPIFEKYCKKHDVAYEIVWSFNGSPFICENEKLIASLDSIISPILGKQVLFDAKGATSDGRFLSKLAQCIEIGFQEDMAHKVDECIKIDEIKQILQIYSEIFAKNW